MTTHPPLLTVFLACMVVVAPTGQAGADDPPDTPADTVMRALAAARDGVVDGFRLRVDSSTDDGFRSVQVFDSGAGIWNGRVQIRLTPEVRTAVLDALLASGFAGFEPRYGGKPRPEGEAALRVIRRVVVEVGEVSKSSVQLADGARFEKLELLAESLLDLVAPLAAQGVTADSLADGLDKLAAGVLAPETLTLRFVELPPSDADQVGSILRVEDGAVTRRAYAPGKTLGEAESIDLSDEAFVAMVRAVSSARPASLPVNLWAPSYRELEVQVLQHRHAVIARPFSRLSPDDDAAARERFEELVATLQGLGEEPAVSSGSEDASD
jgi:hypothetical protein